MAFFSKLRQRLGKSSSKIEQGLEDIVRDGGREEELDASPSETSPSDLSSFDPSTSGAAAPVDLAGDPTDPLSPAPEAGQARPEWAAEPEAPEPAGEPVRPAPLVLGAAEALSRPATSPETVPETVPEAGRASDPAASAPEIPEPSSVAADEKGAPEPEAREPGRDEPMARAPEPDETAEVAFGMPSEPEPDSLQDARIDSAAEAPAFTMSDPAPSPDLPPETPAPEPETDPEPEPQPAPEPEPEPVPAPDPLPEREPEPTPPSRPEPQPEPLNIPPGPSEIPPEPPQELPGWPEEVPPAAPEEIPSDSPPEVPGQLGAAPLAARDAMPDDARHETDDAPEDEAGGPRRGFFGRMFSRTEQKKTVIRRELDDAMLESLEELLISADMGVDTALRVTANMAEGRFGKRLSVDEIKELLAREITRIMEPVARPMPLYPKKPQVVLVVGVNGSGKTTTIGKLASQFRDAGKSVIVAAGDTFRAAAVEQLQVWGQRAGVPVMTAPQGADPASLAFDAMARAEAEGTDLLMIDTAGRLQNRQDLMQELAKIVRVIRKRDETAPHNTLLVLDATTGQNALSQVEIFQKLADVSGLVMTKLDGTAKGGVLVALADKFGLPIHAIGVGEQIDDLAPFEPEDFANALAGLDG